MIWKLHADRSFLLAPKNQSDTEFQLTPDKNSSNDHFHFMRTQGRAWVLPGSVKNYLLPNQSKTCYKNADFLSEFEQLMDRVFYLGPLREYPKREYQWAGVRPDDVGIQGERTIDVILSAVSRNERRNLGGRTRYKPFEEIVAHWLSELLRGTLNSAMQTNMLS